MPENVTGFQPPGNIKKSLIDLTYFDMLPRRSPTFFREEPFFGLASMTRFSVVPTPAKARFSNY